MIQSVDDLVRAIATLQAEKAELEADWEWLNKMQGWQGDCAVPTQIALDLRSGSFPRTQATFHEAVREARLRALAEGEK